MSDGEDAATAVDEGAMVAEARASLAAGRNGEQAFAALAARTGRWGVSLLAVCEALGVPRPDAEARLRELEGFFSEFAVGEEEDLAFTLAFGHAFLVDRVPEPHDVPLRDLLATAAGARGGFPAGLLGWFRTGELTKIFLYFAKTRFWNERGSPPDFWAAMIAAGELLAARDGADHGDVTAGLERCRAQAAALDARGRPGGHVTRKPGE
ncbi:hypothetical protein [Streptomyces sp. NPDC097619]|uniref:hypothetical protein n=1 Tax=Streptomyces sp. NPDC097619 TaxID=3157228 RepID=UPI003324CA11